MLLNLILPALVFQAYGQGHWVQKSDFYGPARSGAVGFVIGGEGYIATGAGTEGKDLWEYDPLNDVWTQKADITGEGRARAVGFSIGSFGYVGTGAGSDYLKDFRQYDPLLNQWTNKAKFPGDKRAVATGFSIGDKGYIGLGYGAQSDLKGDFYEYDPATDTWTQIADLPGADRSKATGFSIGSKGYVVFGSKSFSGATTDLWEYDPVTGEWTQKTSCPCMPRHGAVAFVIDDKAYAGTGIDDDFNYFNDFWQYDPASDTWIEVDSLPGSRRELAVGFSIGEKGYVGTGWMGVDNYFDDFYEFTPSACAIPTNLTATNISIQSAKLKWDSAGGAVKYKVQYKSDSTGASWISKTINAGKTAITITGLSAGTSYKWKVRSICGGGPSEYSSTALFTTSLKLENEMGQQLPFEVYPNPFTSFVTVSFFANEEARTLIEVFDLVGRKTVLLDELINAGDHEITLHRKQLGKGLFFIQLISGNQTSVIKVMVQ
jgi:N-acetylneuraminic acid mutarotase